MPFSSFNRKVKRFHFSNINMRDKICLRNAKNGKNFLTRLNSWKITWKYVYQKKYSSCLVHGYYDYNDWFWSCCFKDEWRPASCTLGHWFIMKCDEIPKCPINNELFMEKKIPRFNHIVVGERWKHEKIPVTKLLYSVTRAQRSTSE